MSSYYFYEFSFPYNYNFPFSNFDSIRSAVAEGRRLFLNIQRFIVHLLTTNVAEVILLIVGLAFQDQNRTSVFPLSPLGVLWVNLVRHVIKSRNRHKCINELSKITSAPPAFGLGVEKAPQDLMKRKPHPVKEGAFTWPIIIDTFVYGVVMGGSCLLSVSHFFKALLLLCLV